MIRSLLRVGVSAEEPARLTFAQMYFKTTYIRQPKMKYRTCEPIFPPPGLSLEIPEWEPELFLKRIGGGTSEYADKFETLNEMFTLTSAQMNEKGVPTKARKHILNMKEQLRRGVLTFEYLNRRTALQTLKG